MPSFSDSIFLFVLALLLFGPKKLPVLARELGKWVGEFRRASNEFKMQMEEELRLSEQEERQKQISAMEAAAPVAQPVETPPDTSLDTYQPEPESYETTAAVEEPAQEPASEALPIATAGELKMMPPSTGLPEARRTREADIEAAGDPLGGGLLEAIPSSAEPAGEHEHAAVALAAEGETSA